MKFQRLEQVYNDQESNHEIYQTGLSAVVSGIEEFVQSPGQDDVLGVNIFAVIALKDGTTRVAEVDIKTNDYVKIRTSGYSTDELTPEAAYASMMKLAGNISNTITEFDQHEKPIPNYGIIQNTVYGSFEEILSGEVTPTTK